jgi:F-type H+-transporting ATPase subunit beta
MNIGKVVQVVGAVVDVEFPMRSPDLQRAEGGLHGRESASVAARSAAAPWRSLVRTISMAAPGDQVRLQDADSGGPISMPVGDGVMGRVVGVTGSRRRAWPVTAAT